MSYVAEGKNLSRALWNLATLVEKETDFTFVPVHVASKGYGIMGDQGPNPLPVLYVTAHINEDDSAVVSVSVQLLRKNYPRKGRFVAIAPKSK